MKANAKNPGFAIRLGWLLHAVGVTRRQLCLTLEPERKRADAVYSRIGRWEREGKAPSRAEVASVVRVVVPADDLDVTLTWLLVGGAAPEWLRGRVPEASGGAIVPDVSAPSSPAQPATRGVLAPAMPVNLFMRVARVVRREGKKALEEEQSGRGDLDSLEVATAFEKWIRSLSNEERAQLSSGFTGEDPSYLLQYVDDHTALPELSFRFVSPDGGLTNLRHEAA